MSWDPTQHDCGIMGLYEGIPYKRIHAFVRARVFGNELFFFVFLFVLKMLSETF